MEGAHFVRMVLNGVLFWFLTINTFVFIFWVSGFSLFLSFNPLVMGMVPLTHL